MSRVVVTRPADADILHILDHLKREAGLKTATQYSILFERLFDRLAAHPESGPLRRDLGSKIRIGIVLPYIVIYRHTSRDDLVAIIRIVHGIRRMTAKILQDLR